MSEEETKRIAGRYRLESVVGSGSSAEVWSAWDTVLSRRVAIKLLGAQTDEEKSRVWREARLAALLGDSVAVPIFDFGDDGDESFLVMELVTDPSLRAVFDRATEPLTALALALAAHLVTALAQTHALSIVHRDVKPENIFVSSSAEQINKLRLVDFGLAFRDGPTTASLGRLTDAKVLSGTPVYLSPEQARGADIGPPTDIYSAGCVLYEASCGHPPFGGTLGELLSKHMYIPAIPLRERIPQISPDFADLIDAMLVKAPENRPTAAHAMEHFNRMLEKQPNSHLAFEERVKQSTRAERMVEASASALPTEVGANVIAIGPLPSWLKEKLVDAGISLVAREASPDYELTAFGTDSEEESPAPSAACPRIVWASSAEELTIPRLIAQGIYFAISPESPVSALRRKLRPAAQQLRANRKTQS